MRSPTQTILIEHLAFVNVLKLPPTSFDLQGLKDTTKARDGFQRVPLMNGIGVARFVDDISYVELRNAATVLRTVAEARTAALDGPTDSSPAASAVYA